MKRYYFGKGPRAVATWACYVVNDGDQRARELLDRELERSGFDRRDRDLTTELVYGTLRRRGTLDRLVAAFSRVPLYDPVPCCSAVCVPRAGGVRGLVAERPVGGDAGAWHGPLPTPRRRFPPVHHGFGNGARRSSRAPRHGVGR